MAYCAGGRGVTMLFRRHGQAKRRRGRRPAEARAGWWSEEGFRAGLLPPLLALGSAAVGAAAEGRGREVGAQAAAAVATEPADATNAGRAAVRFRMMPRFGLRALRRRGRYRSLYRGRYGKQGGVGKPASLSFGNRRFSEAPPGADAFLQAVLIPLHSLTRAVT